MAYQQACSACAGENDEAASQWEPWDPRKSLFDNHMSSSTEANLEYMWKNFGFYIPDSQFLVDPEGLIKYLVSLVCLIPLGLIEWCALH